MRYVYSVAAEWRRVLLLAIVGCISLAAIAWIVDEQVVQRGIAHRLTIVAIFGGPAGWFAQLLLPSIQVDRLGISRRVLWWWDCWSWDSFAEGRIHPGFMAHSFERPESPWWCRKLQLGYLEEGDIQTIEGLITVIWKPRSATVPEAIEFKIQWPDGRHVVFDKTELTISSKWGETRHRWEAVLGIEIWRLEPGRRDFRELIVRLPDQEVKLHQWNHQGQQCNNWTGIQAELMASYLSQHVDATRWQDFSLTGEPRSLSELDARAERQEQQIREANRVTAWCLPVMWGLSLSPPLWMPWPNCLAMSGMMILLVLAPAHLIRRYINSTNATLRRDLQKRREVLLERDAHF